MRRRPLAVLVGPLVVMLADGLGRSYADPTTP
jgi:hypothetical protein